MHFWQDNRSIRGEICCITGHYVGDYDGTGPEY